MLKIKHTHKKQRSSYSDTLPFDEQLKLQLSDDEQLELVLKSHSVSSRCNQAYISLKLYDNFIIFCDDDHNYNDNGKDYHLAIINDRIVVRLQPCSLVQKDMIVLDNHHKISLGGLQSNEIVRLRKWDRPFCDFKSSQIWVSLTMPNGYYYSIVRSKFTDYPVRGPHLEKLIRSKFHGQVLTKDQVLLLDTSKYDHKPAVMFHMTIIKIVGCQDTKTELTRGLVEKNTVIRVFPSDNMSQWKVKIAPINLIQEGLTISFLENALNKLNIGGMALHLKTILEGIFGPNCLHMPDSLSLRLAPRFVKGILLHGESCTGKTLLATTLSKILGTEEPKILEFPTYLSNKDLKSTFKEAVRDQKINHCWRGNDEKKNRLHLFIIEEIDLLSPGPSYSFCGAAETLATLMDTLDNILIIGTTRCIDRLHPELFRSGLFELQIKLNYPDEKGRLDILKLYTRPLIDGKFVDEDELDLADLASRTHGFRAFDLNITVVRGVNYAMAREIRKSGVLRTSYVYTSFGAIAKETKVSMNDLYIVLKRGYRWVQVPSWVIWKTRVDEYDPNP